MLFTNWFPHCCWADSVRDVATSGLDDAVVLPSSQRFDSVLCAIACDINCDGTTELLLGTYGQELLVYNTKAASPAVRSPLVALLNSRTSRALFLISNV
jgi:hypothetical protein